MSHNHNKDHHAHTHHTNSNNDTFNVNERNGGIESELGQKIDREGDENVNENNIGLNAPNSLDPGAEIENLPNPSDIEEADKELSYLKNAYKNLKKELAESNENYLKSLAEMENFRKRMNRDKEESLKYSNEKIIRDMLPVLDFLDLAIKHAEPFLEKDESGNFKSFISGVKYANDEFIKVLKSYGAEEIDTAGKPFDANFHEAVVIVEDPNYKDGDIVEEKRKGYKFKERLLRPSMVSIAKNKNN